MALRPLLSRLAEHPDGAALIADGGRAFVSQSMRPYLVAALADGRGRPTARRSWWPATTARRATSPPTCARGSSRGPVRFYPSRGVAYESHLAPPPHLVGLRVAALDALLAERADGEEPPVVVVSAVALSEKVPDPALRPHSFTIRVGDLLDLDEVGQQLVAAGYERVDQVDDRGQFAIRGGILDLYPATEDRAVRIDLFDIEVESIRFFSTFTQRSLGETEAIEIAPAAELAPEHRELAEIAALEDAEDRPDVAELLPVDRFQAFLDLGGRRGHPHRRRGGRGARRSPTTGRTCAPPSTTTTPTTSTSSPTRSPPRSTRARASG